MLFEILQQTALLLHMMKGCHFHSSKMLLLKNTETNSDFFPKFYLSMLMLELIMPIYVRH